VRPKLTVIFDRSAFHGGRFDLLRGSALSELVKRNVILVHHSTTFLEETISMYERESNHAELRRQLPFILDICNGRWFAARSEIWQRELVQNRGALANVFLKERERKVMQTNMRQGVFQPGRWDILDAIPHKDIEREKSRRLRSIHVQARHDIAQQRRSLPHLKNQRPPDPVAFIRQEIDEWGRQTITRYVGRTDKSHLVDRWRGNKEWYPYLTTSLQGQIYAFWYAMIEQNKPIDENAHVDVDLLSCLNSADAIVSADDRFLKDAFDVLWLAKGKLFFSPERFVQHLSLIST
jgi:hypothetical protein